MNIKFRDKEHKELYSFVLNRMESNDRYHESMAYLLTLDTSCCKHIESIFDFKRDCIKPDAIKKAWQTGTSKKTTRLAFNLWNGCYDDGETYTDKDGDTHPLPSRYYAVDNIFSSEYAKYYLEAIKLRFPDYT